MYKHRMNTVMLQLEEVERERDQVRPPGPQPDSLPNRLSHFCSKDGLQPKAFRDHRVLRGPRGHGRALNARSLE